MGIIALLAWYDEAPAWLYNAIRSLEKLPAQHLIAIDGAYQLYPEGKARSHIDQYAAIHDAAAAAGIGCTVHTPHTVWRGNEVEKRSKLFQLGDQVADPNQTWFFVLDADEVITAAPDDLHAQLAATSLDVAAVTFSEPHPTLKRRDYPMPVVFRAIPGIRVDGNHFTYVTPDGRYLWGNATVEDLEPRLDLTQTLRLEHLTHYRDRTRAQAATLYYDQRDERTAETFQCGHADCTATAKHPLPMHWHPNTGGYVAEWVWACRTHRTLLANRGRYELSQHVGWDTAAGYYERKLWLTSSDDLKVEHRAGPVPA